jgi:hypothetical protein
VADSDPEGAQVFINGKLTTATDDTLNLSPGTYEIEIKKDGFISWKKTLEIQAELVTQTAAKLFPSVPNLTPFSFTGANDPTPSPDGRKIVYQTSSASAEPKNGLWVLELADRNLPIARASEPRQIVRNTTQRNYSNALLLWSPDSSQVLAYWVNPLDEDSQQFNESNSSSPRDTITQAVLLDTSRFNDAGDLKDATNRLPVLLSQWHHELDLKEQEQLAELPKFMQLVATKSAELAHFSPDEQRLLYAVGEEATIPDQLIPDLPSESTQPEERSLEVGGIYVYDIKEDKNYRVSTRKNESDLKDNPSSEAVNPATNQQYWENRLTGIASASATASQLNNPLPPVPTDLLISFLDRLKIRYSPIWTEPVQWFPTSAHIIEVAKDSITIIEYDGQNNATVYAGPFTGQFAYPWPNGSRLVILTNLNNQGIANNLYGISLK